MPNISRRVANGVYEICRLTETGFTQGLSKVNSRLKPLPAHTATLTEVTEQESEALLDQREGSHDYD